MPPAIIGGSALLGGIAGAFGKQSSQSTTSSVDAGQATGNEVYGQQGMMDMYRQLQGFVGAGPGQADVAAGYGAQKDLADTYQKYAQGGYLPGAEDQARAGSTANALFAPQQAALNNSFQDQSFAANRSAAAMGASGNDPILAAKMRTEQTRQQQGLDASRGAFGQQLAMAMPMQRLGFQEQHAQALGGLATQAMANRQALAAMGEGIMNNERNFRLATATRTSNQETQSGGGVGGFITGALGGAGVGMSAAGAFGNFGGQQSPGGKGSAENFLGGGTGLQQNPFGAWGGGASTGGFGRGMIPQSGQGF
jgi:hypothetical protein